MEEADGSVHADRDEGEQGDAMEIEGQEDIGAKDKQDGAQEREFSMEILPLIKEAQNQHGLRHGDYQRYRMYCTRRLRRIRKSLGFTQGHRHRYHKRELKKESITEVRFLYLPLVCAERAWALGMELKQESHTEPRKRFHLLRRLNKAAKYANELLHLSEGCGRCDARTRLEAEAYYLWINGNVLFEQQKWKEALDAFGKSQTIYQQLSSVVDMEQRAVYQQRVEEISPSIRYCAYNIGDMPSDINELMKLRTDAKGFDMLASKIDEVLVQTKEKTSVALIEVVWQGKTVPVKSERVRLSLVKLRQMEGEVERVTETEEKIRLCEELLMECQDGIQLVRDEINQDLAAEKKRSQKTNQKSQNLEYLLLYFTNIKLSHSITRNLLLLETMQKPRTATQKTPRPEEFVRVYDILLQHLTELSGITESEDDLSLQKKHAAQSFMFKSFRCFYLADSYAQRRKWAESLGLLERTGEHIVQALELYREQGHSEEQDVMRLQQLQETVRGRKYELHVNNILEVEGLEEQVADMTISDKPLSEQHNVFTLSGLPDATPLAPLPPDYKPLPGKPLFFDLALNHIEFPSLQHRTKQSGGITGFVKDLFWGQ